MRRPLAVAGTCVLFSLLVATRLSANGLIPLSMCLLIAGIVLLWVCRKGRRAYIPLVLIACGLSFVYKFSYDMLVLRPVESLNGETATVQAVVESVSAGYTEETALLQLHVQSVEGYEQLGHFRVKVNGVQPQQVNDFIALTLQFESRTGYDETLRQYADGIYLLASPVSQPQLLGEKHSILGAFTLLRESAGDNIAARLPQRLSSVLSAISLGDVRSLSSETKQAYRMAGLSHVLVVSGMHLSLVCFALYYVVLWFTKHKKYAVIASVLGVLFFVLFTGFTPSMIRGAIACTLVLSAPLFNREADPFTALGFAALVLCLQTPYAVVDVGMQFSLFATFGVLVGSRLLILLRRKWHVVLHRGHFRILFSLLSLAVISLFSMAATLPVVIFNQLSFSLFTVPSNILVVPLLTLLVVGGFLLALPVGLVPLDFLLRPVAFFEGILLVFLEKVTEFCGGLPWMSPSIGGLFALTAVLLCYIMLALSVYTKWKVVYRVSAVVVLVGSLAFAQWQAASTVTVSVAGTGPQASLVVSQNGQATVLYRGRNSLYEIEQIWEREGIRHCTLWIDLRKTTQTSEAEQMYAPDTLFVAQEDMFYREILPVTDEVSVYILRQEEGILACVDIDGYKVGIANGAMNVQEYPTLDGLLASNAAVQGEFHHLIVTNEVPLWAGAQQAVLQNGGSATFLIRPGRSVAYKEESRDLFFSKMG